MKNLVLSSLLVATELCLASGTYNPPPRIPEKRVFKENKSQRIHSSEFLCKEHEPLKKCHERFKRAMKRNPAGMELDENN